MKVSLFAPDVFQLAIFYHTLKSSILYTQRTIRWCSFVPDDSVIHSSDGTQGDLVSSVSVFEPDLRLRYLDDGKEATLPNRLKEPQEAVRQKLIEICAKVEIIIFV